MRSLPAILLIAALTASEAAATEPATPFADAALAPRDTTVYIHVDDAAALRRRLADHPIAAWVGSLVGGAVADREYVVGVAPSAGAGVIEPDPSGS